jgi:hypothetical protein
MRLFTAARMAGRRFSPRLESLEDRFCPVAPSISLMHSLAGPNTFLLSGRVTDELPGGLTVQFSGAYSGSVVTSKTGCFSLTIHPDHLGSVFAQVTDAEGLSSSGVEDVLTSMPPMICNFTAMHLYGNVWSFSGTVADESPAGLTVTFGGLPSLVGKTATVNANGTFSLTVELLAGEEGTATAQTCDWWGQASNEAWCLVDQA